MRILTVRQPWAWAIIHGGKDVENRSRNIAGNYRGPVAIHVALRDDDDAFEIEHPMYAMVFGPCPHAASVDHNRYHCEWCTKVAPSKYGYKGQIIGLVDLGGVHRQGAACLWSSMPEMCSPWAERECYHLELENPRSLSDPIPYRGALGLREVPADLLARIEAAL